MTSLRAGTVATLTVSHESPFGYFLDGAGEDILLHRREIIEPFNPEVPQKVFLYQDHRGRLAATMKIPDIRIDTYGWATVAGVRPNLGVFVSIGIQKDMLLSKDDLPVDRSEWPAEGDRLYCSLKLDKKNRLFAKLADADQLRAHASRAEEDAFNRDTDATVCALPSEGVQVITEDGYFGFIHQSETTKTLHLGQKFHGRIIGVKTEGTVNLSMRPRSFETIDENAEKIYNYMSSRGGSMPYSDKSLPEDIRKRFSISKGDFKKALGKLMKEGKVDQKNGWSFLKSGRGKRADSPQ